MATRTADLVVGPDGYPAGHPELGREWRPASSFLSKLETSHTTLTQMIRDGDIDGFWFRPVDRQRFSYFAYTDAVDAYIETHGALGHQRRDRPKQPTIQIARVRQHPSAEAPRLAPLEAQIRELATELVEIRRMIAPSDVVQQLNAERQRRLELEDALSALQTAEEQRAQADRLRDQGHAQLEAAYQTLHQAFTKTRLPRSPGELPDISPAIE